jgi:predicted transcriptional regulator
MPHDTGPIHERDHMPGRPPVPVDRVKQLLAEGVKQSAIAERLGVSKTVVCCIAHGKYVEGSK